MLNRAKLAKLTKMENEIELLERDAVICKVLNQLK